jgi:hypothetical protein
LLHHEHKYLLVLMMLIPKKFLLFEQGTIANC